MNIINYNLAVKAATHCGSPEDAIAEIDAWMNDMQHDPQLISGPLDIRAALMKLSIKDYQDHLTTIEEQDTIIAPNPLTEQF